MLRNILILLALIATVGLPFALRPKDNLIAQADETLIIVSPHNEAIRYEFSRGFRDWYKAKTGKSVRIDWRIPGGTTEIARYLASEYQAPFEHYWRTVQRQQWSQDAQRAFDDSKIKLGVDPAKDQPPMAARRAFLESKIGIGIDLFFGGGSFDFIQQGAAGRLVDSGFIQAHPELFGNGPDQIPQTLGGEEFWDKGGTWLGTVVSAFGICYNVDGVNRAVRQHMDFVDPVRGEPEQDAKPSNWDDLGAPAFFGQVALADPNKSGSVAKAFEMIVQQHIIGEKWVRNSHGAALTGQETPEQRAAIEEKLKTLNEASAKEPATSEDIRKGWNAAMQSILRMGANTRYFADAATKIPIDIGDGDGAIGMAIDFYGRFQAESSKNPRTGKERMHYFNPPGGTSIGVDSIGLLRGAPHKQLALDFIEYVMSVEGQKLWNFKTGTPGGPEKYALRRLPIRHELYTPEMNAHRSDPTVFPYDDAKNFTYHPEWTAALFNPIRFIVRVMCIDPHDEAREAWAELIKAKFPPQAMAKFEDVSKVNYDNAGKEIRDALRSTDPLVSVRLAKDMSEHFRAQYRQAAALAREGK